MQNAGETFDKQNAYDPVSATERCILGTMMQPVTGPACQADATDMGLLPEMFSPARRRVYESVEDRHDGSLAVAMRLDPDDRAEVFRCMREASVPGEFYRARVGDLVRTWRLRAARSGASSVAEEPWVNADDMRTAVDERVLVNLEAALPVDSVDDSVATLLDSGVTEGEQVAIVPEFRAFDVFRRGRMVVIGARPKVGKSVLGLQIVSAAGRCGSRVLLASLEMAREEQVQRLRRGNSDDDLRAMQIDIVTHAKAPTIEALHRLCRSKAVRHGGLDLVVLDYIQIARCENEGRMSDPERVAKISREAKLIAGSLNCCVVVLAQLKRASEDRASPRASDLANSDAMQRDADHVLLLHRPHMHGGGDVDEAMLLHDISRHGGTGLARLRLDTHELRFKRDVR